MAILCPRSSYSQFLYSLTRTSYFIGKRTRTGSKRTYDRFWSRRIILPVSPMIFSMICNEKALPCTYQDCISFRTFGFGPTPRSHSLFDLVTNRFHKEPNIEFGGGSCIEFAFVKLAKSYVPEESVLPNK